MQFRLICHCDRFLEAFLLRSKFWSTLYCVDPHFSLLARSLPIGQYVGPKNSGAIVISNKFVTYHALLLRVRFVIVVS